MRAVDRLCLLGNWKLLLGNRRSGEGHREGSALLCSVPIIKAGFYKAFKERMCIIWFGNEFGVVLYADAPGMIWPFDGFDQIAILGQPADYKATFSEGIPETVGDLVSVSVTFLNGFRAIDTQDLAAAVEVGGALSQPHSTTHQGNIHLLFQKTHYGIL